tara:strand:+ start:170 stop:571 length:402 start_codon:yes stop_codon:yes gene_type:complete
MNKPLLLNITQDITTTLIDGDVVNNPIYGYSNNRLRINSMFIANSDTADADSTLYVRLVKTIYNDFNPVTDEFGSDDENTTVETINLLYKVILPSGTTLKMDSDVFKDVDFKEYELQIFSANAEVDVTINFKN